jgi:4-oxalmesaconate hydratase
MIVDCHAHYTSEPKAWHDFRAKMVAALEAGSGLPSSDSLKISDDEIRAGLDPAQIAMQRERGIDRTIFSARASAMGHHLGDFAANLAWSRMCNDMIHRLCTLYPDVFVGGVQLPQSVGGNPKDLIGELERCVRDYGFVSCNLNPDPSGGYFTSPPLTDKSWYPFYEKLVELDVPAMVHVSGCCNPAMHTTSSYYLNGDTTGFTQLMLSNIFNDFPTLKFIIPHGGGAIPYHWGRFRGISFMNGKPELTELMAQNIFFDTCVYHQPGIDLLLQVVPIGNIIFASELVGAVKGIDPATGHEFDDTRRYIEAANISPADRQKIFEENPLRVFSRLKQHVGTP